MSLEEPEVVIIPASDALLEDPPRSVHENIFAIARRPVSNREYSAFVAETAHATPRGWSAASATERATNPVEGVSWADAVAYCRWLSVSTGKVYRLPDEREWEKTARGSAGRRWPCGDADDARRANVRDSQVGATTPIGKFPDGASPDGVLDLIGNVREWTNTWSDGRVPRAGSYLDALVDACPRAASERPTICEASASASCTG